MVRKIQAKLVLRLHGQGLSGRAIARSQGMSRRRVVPEFLRTLVFARPRGDDQFADCTFSPSLDMSR